MKKRGKAASQKVNVAVVGLGFMGVTHLRAYLDEKSAHVVAVCDSVRLPVNGVLAGVAGRAPGRGLPEVREMTALSPLVAFGQKLPGQDLNLDQEIQSLLCYRYTTG